MPEEEKESLWDMLTGKKINDYFLDELEKDYNNWLALNPLKNDLQQRTPECKLG